MNGTFVVDGRVVNISVNSDTGQIILDFPDVHVDPTNPGDHLQVVVTPSMTIPGLLAIVQTILDRFPSPAPLARKS